MVSYAPSSLDADGQINGNGIDVVLEPDKWVGKRFPLIKHTSIGDGLSFGKWIVLLHRRDCPVCRDEIERLSQLAGKMEFRHDSTRIALIEVGESGLGGEFTSRNPDRCLQGTLNESKIWHVATPVSIIIQDGTVIRVSGAPKREKRISE